MGSDKRIYPGDDNNFDKQCENYGTNNAKKYPLFSMEQAIKFLRQFRSSGGILYRIVTQFGDYYYDNDDTYRTKTIQHPDATGTSSIEIGPVMTKSQRQSLPCASTYNIETGKNSNGQSRPFNDDDLVKVRFVFSNEHLVANQPYAYGFQFLDSNTVVRNCGFYFRHDNGDKKNTFMFLSAKSG